MNDVKNVTPKVLPQEAKESENGREAFCRDVTALDWSVGLIFYRDMLKRKKKKKTKERKEEIMNN